MNFYQKQEYKFCQYLVKNTINKPQTYTDLFLGVAIEIGVDGEAGLKDLMEKFDREEFFTKSYSKIDAKTNVPKQEDRLYSISNKGIVYFNHLIEISNIEAFTIDLHKSTIKTNVNMVKSTRIIAWATIANLIITAINCWVSCTKHDEIKVLTQQPQIQTSPMTAPQKIQMKQNYSPLPSLKTSKK